MSPYAEKLANARLDALLTLVEALKEADSPEEKRRCAVAIFKAPDPCDLDDEIELVDDDQTDEADEVAEDECDADDINDENEDSEDDDTHDAGNENDSAAAPPRKSPPAPTIVDVQSNVRRDVASPAPPDPKGPLA